MSESPPTAKRPDLGKFSLWGILGLSLFLFLLQTNGATLGVLPSLIGYLIASAFLVGSLLLHAIPHWASHHRILSVIGGLVLCTAATWWGCQAQSHKQIRSLIPITNATLDSPMYDGTPRTPLLLSVSPAGATAEVKVEPQSKAGTYRATVSGVGDYVGRLDLEWAVQRRPLTVTLPSPTKVYDGSVLTLEDPKIEGLVTHDLVFVHSVPSYVGPAAGEYAIKGEVQPDGDVANYEIKVVEGRAKIAGRDFSALVRDQPYDGLPHQAEVFALYPSDAELVVLGAEQTDCGTYKATLSGRKNYQGTEKTVEWKITPAATSLAMGTVRGADATGRALILPIEVRGVNPTGQILMSLFDAEAGGSRGTIIGEKTNAELQHGAAVIEYALPMGISTTTFLAKVEYLGDRNNQRSVGQVMVTKPTFVANSSADAVHHLRAALAELRQVYVADSANTESQTALKAVAEIVSRLNKDDNSTTRFELAHAFPAIEPDIDHAIAGLEILQQLIKASSDNQNLLGRYHAPLANSFYDIDITKMYLGILREAAKSDKKQPGYGPSYVQNLPMLCRQLRATIQTILEDMEPELAVPSNSLTIAESIGTVEFGSLHITVKNLKFIRGSRQEGRSNYATCTVEFTNTGSGDIRFAANGDPGDPNRLRCHLRAPNGIAFVASDFSGFTSVAVEADNPQPDSIAWSVMYGHNAEVAPSFFSLRRAVWLGSFSVLRAGQKISGTITFFPQDRDDLYRDMSEGAEKLAVQFIGDFVFASGGNPAKSCQLFEAKIDKPVHFPETKR